MGQLHLQGIGKVDAVKAKDLRVGDVTVWNYGSLSKVISITPSKTGKTLKVGLEYKNYHGEIVQSERKLGSERLVGIDK